MASLAVAFGRMDVGVVAAVPVVGAIVGPVAVASVPVVGAIVGPVAVAGASGGVVAGPVPMEVDQDEAMDVG